MERTLNRDDGVFGYFSPATVYGSCRLNLNAVEGLRFEVHARRWAIVGLLGWLIQWTRKGFAMTDVGEF